MGLGRITGSDVNFRETPGGKVIRPLALDTQVEILAPGGDWTKVAIGGQSGFVSSHFIAEAPPAAPEPGDVPPPDPGSIEVDANTAFTPDRQVFARRQGLGYFTAGQTTIEDFLASPA